MRNSKLIISAAVAMSAILGIGMASAADMAPAPRAYTKAPAVPVTTYNWTGCYVGGNTGGAWAQKSAAETGNSGHGPFLPPIDAGSLTFNGWAYGGQIGCDYQFNGNLVVGVRGMWDGSDLKGSAGWPAFPVGDLYSNHSINSFGTVVGKIGFLPYPTLELYGVGGVAWVHDSLSFLNPAGIGLFATGDQTRTGYDVGVGLSWMFAQNWDVWIEYDHMGFGSQDASLTGVGASTGVTYYANSSLSVDKVLLGIDYRFSWGGPVVAKY
jgi:outer membrane immunogenic protein